ncbi:MAG: signal recognition particle protein [Actinobacteria bacterium]|nr:signal recognition particle protein [Actinomycetota bacterium]MBL7123561.1 signal recognition particle protein [Actinomycetota bacterium]
MFDLLTAKFEDLFYKIRNKGKLSPNDLDSAFREIRLALLEADVNFKVVKEFIENVKTKATGEKILESLTPYQHVVKIVNEEIIRMLGSSSGGISFASRGPTIIMTVGLHGSGKTSSVIKLANFLKTKFQKKVSVVAADVYRPAAVLQLEDMAKNIDVDVYSENNSDPVSISVKGVELFKKSGSDVIIIDTAGRLHIDENMMDEIANIRNKIMPHQIYLVLDAMTGQEAVNIASSFNLRVECDGIILTKLDSDTRGGAALSVYYVVKKPVKFVSNGEKIEDFDIFYPERIASRILGKGDILTLIEKAEKVVSEKEAKRIEEKIYRNELNFEDFVAQIRSLKKMGSIDKIFSMMPIVNKSKIFKKVNLDDSHLSHIEAIINSMTVDERRKPHIINGSRKKRIAKGSGSSVSEVNKLLEQFSKTKQMLKQFSGLKGKFNLPPGNF